jgi:hypothetical protein
MERGESGRMPTIEDDGPHLRPEFLRVVRTIYSEMCNLRSGEEVLIIADSRTPANAVNAFFGEAMTFGARANTILVETPPPPSVQTSIEWSRSVAAATTAADLIVDLAVGYSSFLADAIERGARVICPGDGPGGAHLQETLMRTIGAVELPALRQETSVIADMITGATSMRITSDEGTDLRIAIDGLSGQADDGYLWDPDRGDWKSGWQTLPPAVPGVVLPTGRANGVIAVDGFILYEPAYDHETPKTPLLLTVEGSWITNISGDPLTSDRLRDWLTRWEPDRSVSHGPVHANIGLNPRALMTQHQGSRPCAARSCSGGATVLPSRGSSRPGWRAWPRRSTGTVPAAADDRHRRPARGRERVDPGPRVNPGFTRPKV